MLEVGDRPGEFVLNDQHGNDVSWSDFRGKRVVVFFYPRANTPGCSTEASDFQALGDAFTEVGASVVGCSADTSKRQASFAEKKGLEMPLLADTDRTVLEDWGVWGEKKLYGRISLGIVRSTFAFDADGVVTHVWSPVRVKGHAQAVLEALQQA